MSKRADIWMPFYTADYTRDTLHLTRDQHGGYILLLIACWNSGGRLPNEPGILAGITRSTPQEWRKLAPVLKAFFRIEGKFLAHKRVLAELEKAAALSEKRRTTGSLGGRPKKQTESEPKPNGSANGNQNGKQNETPARVTVNNPTSETNHFPSQEGAIGEVQGYSTGAQIIPLGRDGGR